MARVTIQGLIASLLRVAKDLPGQSASDIAFLEERLSDIMDDLSLDADDIARLAMWTEPEMHRCLLSAPDTLMKMAEDKRKTPSLRILSSAAALALILMWEHPALTEKAIAIFDYERDIEGEPGSRMVLRLRPAVDRQPAGLVPEPMSAEAERILDRLIAVRKNMPLPTTLLLPGKDNRPRSVSSAMESIYNQIQGVLSDRMTSSDLRDLNAYIALEDRDADLALVAEGLGYKESRSLERRFGKHLRRNLSSGGV